MLKIKKLKDVDVMLNERITISENFVQPVEKNVDRKNFPEISLTYTC